MDFQITVAQPHHTVFCERIIFHMGMSAKKRGTGIAKRDPEYIAAKIREGKAVIAMYKGELAGFSYIESWEHDRFVANSGLIVLPQFRGHGLAKRIKNKTFNRSRELFPKAKIFSIATSAAVLKMNNDLGYQPVPLSQLTDDDEFWKGCQGCNNYDILQRTERKHCLCTGMLFDPEQAENEQSKGEKSFARHDNFPHVEPKNEIELLQYCEQ